MKPWVPFPAQGLGGAFQPQALWELKVPMQTYSSTRTTLHITSPQNVTKKPLCNTYELLWWRTQVPQKHTFCPEAQEGPEENASKPCEGIECQEEAIRAPGKPKEDQPQTPKGPNHRVHQLAVITTPRFGRGFVATRPRAARLKPRPRLQLWLWFPTAPRLPRRLHGKSLLLPMWRQTDGRDHPTNCLQTGGILLQTMKPGTFKMPVSVIHHPRVQCAPVGQEFRSESVTGNSQLFQKLCWRRQSKQ